MAKSVSVDDVVNVLRERIVNHELPPGAKLREAPLAAEYGISRARLRDAFSILEQLGLIERVRNQGAIVTRLSAEQVDELFAMREVLEALAVRLATENAPKGAWDELTERFGPQAERAIAEHDLDYYISIVTAFREQTIAASQNEILSQTLDGLYDRTKVLIRRLLLVPGRAQTGLIEHRKILAAMNAGDAVLAEQLKRENIRGACEWFRNYRKFIL
ncbi:GntR family transcriptional regulator [Paralimibaculum aggregatum]|uniref:GntR family transcriptional regulator n=1 Tax=Paralimibaculum aggregatum TaxID=3036245 RepID=A0ABQ6LM69_9RHOB|nr:GntR family transcriptional regulator [Limibaculum sp. NKW23]GMG84304.1 GntR family transcriptional regulator [Limibaculum sp. NKW23]